jgi:plasmid stabilization system protein ParE
MRVEYTGLFEARLECIATYAATVEGFPAYERLLDDIDGVIVPNLERFPLIGKPYLETTQQSTEALMAVAKLPRDAGHSLRKYVHDDYILLYVLGGETLHLVSIRHHKESTFNP